MDLQLEANALGAKVNWYYHHKALPPVWFERPDHISVVAPDLAEFEKIVREPQKEQVFLAEDDDERYNVAAKFSGALSVGELGYVRWIDITEPLPVQQVMGDVGVRNLIFLYPDFGKARYFLGARGIPYSVAEFGSYTEIRVTFDEEDNTFSFSNKSFEQVALESLRRGDARRLSPKAA